MAVSEKFACSISVVVAGMFVCLAHDAMTHQYLTKETIIDGLYNVIQIRSGQLQGLEIGANNDGTLTALK